MIKTLLVLVAASAQTNGAIVNPFHWMFRGPQLGLEFASGVVGEFQNGMNKAGLGAITSGPLNAVKAGLDVPSAMVGQVHDKATGMFDDLLSVPQKIADQATASPLTGSQQQLLDAISAVQKQFPGLTVDDIVQMIEDNAGKKPVPAQPTPQELAAELAATKKEVDQRVGVMVSTILEYLEELESLPDGSKEDKEFIAEEIDAVLHRANELMGHVYAAKELEQILLVVEQIYSDFSPLYDEARYYLSEDAN